MNRPKLVMSHLALLSQLKRYSDDDLKLFAKRVGRAGYDAVRVFWTGWGDGGTDLIFPYQKYEGGFNLFDFDTEYAFHLERIARFLGERGVALYVDIYDQCSVGSYWDAWKKNYHGLNGWWDESALGLDAFRAAVKAIAGLIWGATDIPPIIGLGNELQRPDDAGVDLGWVKVWAWPRIQILRDYGQTIPIPVSGGGRTLHKLMGWCGPEDGYFPDPQFTAIIHGIGMTTNVPPNDFGATTIEEWLRGQSVENQFGWSDDGVDCHNWNRVPLDKRGPGNEGGTNYPANTFETVKLLTAFQSSPMLPLYCVDVLPREISDKQHIRELTDEAVNRGPEVMRQVYGEDPMRPPLDILLTLCASTHNKPNETCVKKAILVSEDDPERLVCAVDHTPPDTRTCKEKYIAGRLINKWQAWKYIKCVLGLGNSA